MEKVCIMLSTYNGEKYLEEQLESIFLQSEVDVFLVVRDDGSNDDTIQILHNWSEKTQKVYFPDELNGFHCANGVGSSYMLLLRYCINNFPDVNYFGFADQDDVWKEDKVIRGVKALEKYDTDRTLYFTKKSIVDENLKRIGQDVIRFHNNFCDFLSPNDASGCTMLFNRSLGEQIIIANYEQTGFMHDSILMNVALCTGAKIIYDDYESILYRQHSSNVVGRKTEQLLTRKNLSIIFQKRRHYTRKEAVMILKFYGEQIAPETKKLLEEVMNVKNPISSFSLLKLYYLNSHRSYKDKLRFTATILLNGI